MPLENRTRLDQKDLELIKHGPARVIGSVAAYNSPPFGDSDRDFVELNIYDLNDNYIQTVILASEDWVIQDEDIKVRPGEDLRKLGLVVVSVSPKGKIKTFGKEKNLVQLINDIPKSYKLNIIPVSKKNKRTIDTITKPPGKKDGGIVGISHLIRPL